MNAWKLQVGPEGTFSSPQPHPCINFEYLKKSLVKGRVRSSVSSKSLVRGAEENARGPEAQP